MTMHATRFSNAYSDNGFWKKAGRFAGSAGKKVMETALKLYYAAQDADTPAWAKATIFAALGYFISPVDAIPDIVPAAGFSDDLSVLAAALAATAMHIKDAHVAKAKQTLARWFG